MIKNKIIGLGLLTTSITPIVAVVSCSNQEKDIDRSILNEYGSLSTNIVASQRAFDTNFIVGNSFAGKSPSGPARVLPLIRSSITGKDIPEFTSSNPGSFDIQSDGTAPQISVGFSSKKVEKQKFEGAESVTIGNQTFRDISNIPDSLGSDTITFNIPQNVHYVNYKGQNQKYKLKGKDFLYGMIRTLYASRELRKKGTINQKKYAELPSFSKKDTDLLIKNDNASIAGINNSNTYLLDLFNIDVARTIDENLKNTNDYEFKIVFTSANDAQKTAITGFVANNSMFSPQSSEYIDEKSQKWQATHPSEDINKNPGIKYGISNYLSNNINGVDVSGYKEALSVSPYFYTKFDLLEGYSISKNNSYLDSSWAKNKNTISNYYFHITPEGLDTNANVLQRISNYEKGIETILNDSVKSSPLFQKFKKNPKKSGYTYQKLSESGISNKLLWDIAINPLSLKSNGKAGYNNNGLKMMYGDNATPKNVLSTYDSINEFFNGNGKILRKIINNTVNPVTIIKEGTSLSNKEPLRGFLAPEQYLWDQNSTSGAFKNTPQSNPDYIFSRPTDTATNQDLEDWYSSHTDIKEAFKVPSNYYRNIKISLKNLENKVGASSTDPAQIPIQFWEYKDKAPTPAQEKLFGNIIDTLNSLSSGVKFVRTDALTQNDFIEGVQGKRSTQFHYLGWGPDYPKASSVYQGLFAKNGSASMYSILYHDLITDKQNQYMPDLMKEITKSNSFPILKSQTNSLKNEMDLISIGVIRDWIFGAKGWDKSLTANTKKLLNEIENVVVKPFYNLSASKAATRAWASYYADHALGYPFAAHKGYGSAAKRVGGSAAVETVLKPWLQQAKTSNGTNLLMDYRIDR